MKREESWRTEVRSLSSRIGAILLGETARLAQDDELDACYLDAKELIQTALKAHDDPYFPNGKGEQLAREMADTVEKLEVICVMSEPKLRCKHCDEPNPVLVCYHCGHQFCNV